LPRLGSVMVICLGAPAALGEEPRRPREGSLQMRKSMYVVLALMAGVLLWGFASQTVATAAGPKDVPPGFGNKVAGSYYGDVWVGEEETHAALHVTLSAEGAYMHKTPSKYPVVQGTWARVGNHELEHVAIGWILTDEQEHEYTIRYDGVWVFDDDFQTVEVAYRGALYLPEQDPLDPDEEPLATWPGTMIVRKMTVD